MSDAVTMTRKCVAHSARTGEPCKKFAIRGSTVCQTHGGGAPQVKAKAEQRLRQMVSPMLDRLHQLAMQTDNLKVAGDCVRDALDRAGIGVLVEAKVRQSHKQESHGSGVTVNIGFLAGPMEPQTLDAQRVVMGTRAPVLLAHEASAESEG